MSVLNRGSTVPTATVLPDATGATTVVSTGRTGSGAVLSSLHPAVISVKAKMPRKVSLKLAHDRFSSYVTRCPELSTLPPSMTTRSPGSNPLFDQNDFGLVAGDRDRLQCGRLGRGVHHPHGGLIARSHQSRPRQSDLRGRLEFDHAGHCASKRHRGRRLLGSRP